MSKSVSEVRKIVTFRCGLFDMTRTVNSWIQGFPSRLEQADRELGNIKSVAAAHKQFERVEHHRSNPTGDSRVTRNLIFAAARLNDMLIRLEYYMRQRRERENATPIRLHFPECLGEQGVGRCECFD